MSASRSAFVLICPVAWSMSKAPSPAVVAQRVGQYVAVTVPGRNRNSHVLTRGRVLLHHPRRRMVLWSPDHFGVGVPGRGTREGCSAH